MVHQQEAVVLRTWPVHEADLIVSLFTRGHGKIKGIAKAASKSRRRFGGALEPMTCVVANYAIRPRQELVRLDSCEIITSPLSRAVDYTRAAALAFYSEVLEECLPDYDPQDAVFRLVHSVLEHTTTTNVWMPVTYFALWMLRLMGWMPDILHCTVGGEPFVGRPAYWHAQADGLVCAQHKRLASSVLSAPSQAMAVRIFHRPLAAFTQENWSSACGVDLRRFAVQALERHLERKLTSARVLMKLSG
ncbi:DNA repair protein RecO [Pseudacidobacterium ailaaui]|jgi:DNA repair protein RecO (recombination protein O)|uniref:DNA repair protein RecO n=1 Tax=Pseudacidobacterium ailaaui TaxID=1382359 RepID=UPI00047920BB|nr:DNA repair protein RecO [Pseudacidobacterium ailaaui]